MKDKIYVLINLSDFEIKPIFSSYDKDKVILEVGKISLLKEPTDGYEILEIDLRKVEEWKNQWKYKI